MNLDDKLREIFAKVKRYPEAEKLWLEEIHQAFAEAGYLTPDDNVYAAPKTGASDD